jgi:hypothetical protein
MSHWIPRLLCVAGALAWLPGCRTSGTRAPDAGAPAPPAHDVGALVVNTDRGPLAGKSVDGGVRAFLGKREICAFWDQYERRIR